MDVFKEGAWKRAGFPDRSRASSVFSCATKAARNSDTMRSVRPHLPSSNPRKCASFEAAASTVAICQLLGVG